MTLLFFGAEWCNACHGMEQDVENAAKQTGCELIKCDSEINADIFTQYSVRGVPSLVLLDGEKVERLNGSQSEEQIISFIKGEL